MISITTNKGIKINGPTRWSEVTVELFQNVIRNWDKQSRPQLICLLYGLDHKWIMESKEHNLINVLEQASAFWFTEKMESKCQHVLIIDEVPIVVPTQLGNYSIGQAITCRQELQKYKTYDESVSIALAIYLQPEWNGLPYSLERARELEKKILKMPVVEVHGTGFFLLQAVEQAWQQANERLESVKISRNEQDDFIAQASGIQDLASLADLSIVDKYAQTYMLDPDHVFEKCSFGTVMEMFYLWKKREAFQQRFDNMKKILNPQQ